MPTFRRSLWPLYRQILKHRHRPILVGPWRGEVGFEALYWTPFVDRLRADLKLDADQLIPISRGGAAAWYHAPVGLELYAMRSPQEVRVANTIQKAKTGWMKQYRPDAFDRDVLADAAKTLGLKRYSVLHPSWMYQHCAPFWHGDRGLKWLNDQLLFTLLEPPPLPGGMTLPEQFVAVRFYSRPTFSPTPAVTAFAKETIKQLAQLTHVIVLNSGLHLDDHQDYQPEPQPNVSLLSDYGPLTPETNLSTMAAVMARAIGFVGTYGGLAQLALRFKRPVVSVYENWHSTALPHLHLSQAMSLQVGIPFLAMKIAELAVLQQALPQVVMEPAAPTISSGHVGVIGVR